MLNRLNMMGNILRDISSILMARMQFFRSPSPLKLAKTPKPRPSPPPT